jgi:hypothetical protein
MKLTTHLHLVPRSRMVELYLHSKICLHGVVPNYIIKYRDNFALPFSNFFLKTRHFLYPSSLYFINFALIVSSIMTDLLQDNKTEFFLLLSQFSLALHIFVLKFVTNTLQNWRRIQHNYYWMVCATSELSYSTAGTQQKSFVYGLCLWLLMRNLDNCHCFC